MCDTSNTLPSAALSSAIFLIPSIFPYLSLGLVSASFIVYTLHYYCPSARLSRLKDTITIAEQTLNHAKVNCKRDYLALAAVETRFLRTKLTTSRLHERLLDVRDIPGWKDYVQTMIAVSLSLSTLRRELREVHRSLLFLIEAACQRKLTQDINESQEIIDGALHLQNSWRSRVQCQAHYEV
ncbi:hypothetical protein K438DRAFT_1963821 [Mycena galopus ATCC 62051]|nr:hypothetical protein K438DRAFT_1963821 [Mycena galopus ATCC 62051]